MTITPSLAAKELLRAWANETTLFGLPQIRLETENLVENGSAKHVARWNGETIAIVISSALLHRCDDMDQLRKEFVEPKLRELLPYRHRRSSVRNRVLAALRIT